MPRGYSFDAMQSKIRRNHPGYNLWQKGSYPCRVLMLDCPDGSTWSYNILAQVDRHLETGEPQGSRPDAEINRHNQEETQRAEELYSILKFYGAL